MGRIDRKKIMTETFTMPMVKFSFYRWLAVFFTFPLQKRNYRSEKITEATASVCSHWLWHLLMKMSKQALRASLLNPTWDYNTFYKHNKSTKRLTDNLISTAKRRPQKTLSKYGSISTASFLHPFSCASYQPAITRL